MTWYAGVHSVDEGGNAGWVWGTFAPIRDFKFGRLGLPTINDDPNEQVGEQLSADSAGVQVSRHGPRSLTIKAPLFGAADEPNPYLAGLRMRRQMRSLMENSLARLYGVYINYDFDPELNGWVIPGSGAIAYDQGGISLSSFTFTLDNAYKIGGPRTHRPARRIEAYDRTLATTAKDYLGKLFGADFSIVRSYSSPTAAYGYPVIPLPPEAVDPVNTQRQPVAQGSRAAKGGTVGLTTGLLHGDVVSYEQAESSQNLADCVLYDKRDETVVVGGSGDTLDYHWTGTPGSSTVIADDQLSWEEIYGPDHALAGDVPVMDNGICRVRYTGVQGSLASFAVDWWDGSAWGEQGTAWWGDSVVADTYNTHAYAVPKGDGVLGVVLEWTPERCALRVSTQRSSSDATARIDMIVTLQRGWTAPRFEAYVENPANALTGVQIRWSPYSATAMAWATASTNAAGRQPAAAQNDALWGWNENGKIPVSEPWCVLLPEVTTATSVATALGTLLEKSKWSRYTDTSAYGSTRYSVAITARYGETQAKSSTIYGYASLILGFQTVGHALSLVEAETYINAAGTRTAVADAAGTGAGNNVVNDTQAVQTPSPTNLKGFWEGGQPATGIYSDGGGDVYGPIDYSYAGNSDPNGHPDTTVGGFLTPNAIYRYYVAAVIGGVVSTKNATELVTTIGPGAKLTDPVVSSFSFASGANNFAPGNVGFWVQAYNAQGETGAARYFWSYSPYSTQYTLAWGAVSGATGYRVYMQYGGGGTGIGGTFGMVQTGSTSLTVTTANMSLSAGGTRSPTTNTAYTLAATCHQAITWDPVSGATYNVYRTAANGATGTELLLASGLTSTTYTDSTNTTPSGALPAATTYTALCRVPANTMPLGTYGIWIRARTTVAESCTFQAISSATGTITALTTTTTTTYAWYYLGDVIHSTGAENFDIYGQRAVAGTANVRVDRVMAIRTEGRVAANLKYDGIRDLIAAHTWDHRGIPVCVQR